MLKRRLTEPFGKAGLVVAAIALIFALTGGALAATGNNPLASSSKAKQGKQGKPGKPGPKGDTGATGAAGTNGTNGKDGAPGNAGAPGQGGASGKSVVLGAAGANCTTSNGTSVEVEGSGTKKFVCNGKDGETGFTETLPLEATETGYWAAPGEELEAGKGFAVPISFPIPLPEEPAGGEACWVQQGQGTPPGCEVHFILNNGEEAVLNVAEFKYEKHAKSSACPGTGANPTAAPGNLCVYTLYGGFDFSKFPPAVVASNDVSGLSSGATKAGAVIVGHMFEKEPAVGGTFAVTAPTE